MRAACSTLAVQGWPMQSLRALRALVAAPATIPPQLPFLVCVGPEGNGACLLHRQYGQHMSPMDAQITMDGHKHMGWRSRGRCGDSFRSGQRGVHACVTVYTCDCVRSNA